MGLGPLPLPGPPSGKPTVSTRHRRSDPAPVRPGSRRLRFPALPGLRGRPVPVYSLSPCRARVMIAALIAFGSPVHRSITSASSGSAVCPFSPRLLTTALPFSISPLFSRPDCRLIIGWSLVRVQPGPLTSCRSGETDQWGSGLNQDIGGAKSCWVTCGWI